jgi:hypothetical protein
MQYLHYILKPTLPIALALVCSHEDSSGWWLESSTFDMHNKVLARRFCVNGLISLHKRRAPVSLICRKIEPQVSVAEDYLHCTLGTFLYQRPTYDWLAIITERNQKANKQRNVQGWAPVPQNVHFKESYNYPCLGEISGSHGGEYKDDCLLEYCAV